MPRRGRDVTRLKGVRIAIVAGPEFEDLELLYPYYRFLEEGADVKVIGPEKRSYAGKHGLQISVDATFDEVRPQDFDALFIPGGWMPDRVRRDRKAVEWIREFFLSGRPVGAICHGPQLLISARVLSGYRLTAVSAIKDDLEYAGAIYVDEPVVRDRNLVTSRVPPDLPKMMPVMISLIEELVKVPRARTA
ncbi:MAG: type 1 glutamine amidotransferase domain-containing protein [Nitrososphaerota archaeon]